IGRTILEMFLDGMERSMAADRRHASRHFVDVHYAELLRDPIGVVHRIYDKFGYTYSPRFEQELRRFIAQDRSGSRRHIYSLEQFGLSRDEVIDRSRQHLNWVERRSWELADQCCGCVGAASQVKRRNTE